MRSVQLSTGFAWMEREVLRLLWNQRLVWVTMGGRRLHALRCCEVLRSLPDVEGGMVVLEISSPVVASWDTS